MPLDRAGAPVFVHSTCPHDCPSVCALEVERLSSSKIGKVRGARGNDYTDGVVCAKVGRYAERVHHPGRLTAPLRRVGERGQGRDAYQEISWEAALDEVAEALLKAEQRLGSETVWPYFYAGTMGLVQRDGVITLTWVFTGLPPQTTIRSDSAISRASGPRRVPQAAFQPVATSLVQIVEFCRE